MPGFGWLHLTDLHAHPGPDAFPVLWPNVEEAFLADLERLHGRCGPWDAIFFTGDLAQRGTDAEYATVDATLDVLRERLQRWGSTPRLCAVPGNHDLIRPEARRPEVRLLARWEEEPEILTELVTDPRSPYRAVIDEAFAPYQRWAARHAAWDVPGLLPGEGTAVLERDGTRLGVMGLNTAALQLGPADYEGRLPLDVRQFHAAAGGNGTAWARGTTAALLLTHHGPSWLHPRARPTLQGEVAPPDRFAVHLYGHMHSSASESLAVHGAGPWRRWQGTSLFGLEHWGKDEDRRHGYAAGRLDWGPGESGRLRLWPRSARRPTGFWFLGADPDYVLNDDGGTAAEPVKLRLAPSGPTTLTPEDASLTPDAVALLVGLVDEVHEAEVQRALRLLLSGETLALLAPAGFRVGHAMRALAERCAARKDVVSFRVGPVRLATTMDEWLDHLFHELEARVPGVPVPTRGNRLLALLHALQDTCHTLTDEGRRLAILVDPVESFRGDHRERLVRVLQVLAQLAEERTTDPALESMGVAMSGGEDLARILAGQVAFSAELSPVRASHQAILGAVRPPEQAPPEIQGVLRELGGHPELVRWAASRGGRTGGRPEQDLPWLAEQVTRLRGSPYREQVQRLLAGDPTAWRDSDPALRWSGWIRATDPPGWLGPALEALARRTVA